MLIAIVDDAEPDRELLLSYLKKYSAQHFLDYHCICFYSGDEILKVKNNFDLIFLDIYMTGLDGLATAQELRKTNADCLLIFSTNSTDHAIDGYKVRAFDYLIKPYDYVKFTQTMDLCEAVFHSNSRYITINVKKVKQKILCKDIFYIDYRNHYIQVHTKEKIIRSHMYFNEMLTMLGDQPNFLSCNRNCIINMNYVAGLSERDFLLTNNTSIAINRKQLCDVKQAYSNYIFKKLNGATL